MHYCSHISLPPKLLGALCLLTTLLTLQLHRVGAQTTTALDLFGNGGDSAIFFVPVGSGEPFDLSLATNPQTDQLVTGEVAEIEVRINGGSEDNEVERIRIDEQAIDSPVTINIIGQLYRYVLPGGQATASNYSVLLSTLTYTSNLTLAALGDPPRSIDVTAVNNNGTRVTAVANIMLIPANLEDPVFPSDPIEVDLEENTGVGSLVTTVEATDPEGRSVTYSLESPSSIFGITSSGDVRVLNSAALDYEDENNRVFRVTLIATDTDPIAPRSSSASLVISLTNANDNQPEFTQPQYTFSVVEESDGAVVGTVQATDADGADLNDLRYDFLLANTGLTFVINRESGEISVRPGSALDYEVRQNHSFQVLVTDGLFTNTAQVVVNVIDIADNRPVIAPAEKMIIVNLDIGDNEISLNEGTGGPLVVSDDSPALLGGYASISVRRSGTTEIFPNQYGACECTVAPCLDVFSLCGTSFSLQQDLFAGATTASASGPSVSSIDFQVYSFNGRNDLSNNWLEISSDVKTLFLQTTDDFSVSFWIRVASDSSSSYILTFELGRDRYFSLYEASQQTFVFYYRRDNLPGVTNDDGRGTRVALTFFYDTNQFPIGLRDNQWHFISFTIDYPQAILSVDGYEYRPTRGNYRNQFESRVSLVQLTDGTYHDMPAPILTTTQAQIDSISGKIGGSARSNSFSLDGEMRQVYLTNILDTSTFNCFASCNNRISVAPGASVSSSIATMYNPVTRRFTFSGSATDSQYMTFLQSLVYYSNGFLLPEEQGVFRVISISIRDEEDFGNVANISIVGRSNQRDPVFDANGDVIDGVDFEVNFREGDVVQVPILSPQAFITDDDIDARVEWVAVTIENPMFEVADESLTLVDTPPSVLNVFGAGSASINFTAADPVRATANVFITALLSVRYNNLADEPEGVDRIIRFTVSDGLRTGSAITTIRIETIDDIPSLRLNGISGVSTTTVYTESDPPTVLAPRLLLSDPDSVNMVEASARIEQVFDADNESIAFDSSLLPAGLSCIPASCNGTEVRIMGSGSQVAYQALLLTLSYVNLQQSVDLPNLRDRVVFVTVSDGVSSSDPTANILIDFFPLNPRVILELAAPDQNFTTMFVEDQPDPIMCSNLVRVVDTSITTLESVVVSIRNNLPDGVIENDEIVLSSLVEEDISVEINTALKRITFSQVASVEQYIAAVQRVRYFNGENEPYPINRFVDFLVIPGGGAPNDLAHCNITIINNNDNAPVCEPGTIQSEVPENSVMGTQILVLEATDADIGPDGELSYRMTSGDSSLFDVSLSGEITLVGSVDRESEDEHMLQVEACDSGMPRLCCLFNVTIVVTDVNDNAPSFQLPFYQFSVDENVIMDLGTFTITDGDIGNNALVRSVEIDDSTLSPRTACMGRFVTRLLPVPTLATAPPNGVDFEQASQCNFSLLVTDFGAPSLTGTTTVQVIIQNVDDIPPTFSFDSYTFGVPEENEVNAFVGRVTATDMDSPSVTYSLVNTAMFRIDQDVGDIYILFSSDRDVATRYDFLAEARDPANNSITVPVTVNILAINNDPPVLDLNVTAVDSNNAETPVEFVEEGQPIVIATEPGVFDPDAVPLTIMNISIEVANSGSFGNELLSVVNGPLSSRYMTLNSGPGLLDIEPVDPSDISTVLLLLQNIQYQNTEDEISACRDDIYVCQFGQFSRTIFFSVNDGMFNSIRREAYVTFQSINDPPVVDLDNAAAGIGFSTQFLEGAGAIRIASADGFTVSDSDNVDLVSLTCILTNPLDGSDEFLLINGTLPAGLVSTSDNHTVQITGTSSIENYRTVLSMILYNSVTLNPNTAARIIDVTVSDGELTSEVATTTIILEIENQIPRLDLSALESGVNFTTVFVEEAGSISLSNRVILLDEDDVNMVRLVVTVINSGGTEDVLALNPALITPPLSYQYDYPTLTVSGIANILDYTAIIESITYNNTAEEIGDTTERLVEFIVTDEKGGESPPVVTHISIIPVDDNPPVFTPSDVYNFTVDENAAVQTIVGSLDVMDDDLPPGQDVPMFTFSSASPGFGTSDFFIRNNPLNPYQAQLVVNDEIDFDSRAESYRLTVQASSGPFTQVAMVNVVVNNQADVAPVFVNCPFEYFISENAALFDNVLPSPCGAVDPDNLDTITYSVTQTGIPLVNINPLTGQLSVGNNIDRETIGPEFTVMITISDSTQSTSRNVTVNIIGENEFPPEFSSTSYTGQIIENVISTDSVVDVDATDIDERPDIEADPLFTSRITYSLIISSPTTAVEYFRINNVTGEIFQVEVVDFEEISQFQLEVTAIDNDATTTVRTATVPVIITVQNVNDEPPRFTNFQDFIVVSELLPPLTTFFTFMFEDPDSTHLQLQFAAPTPSEFLLLSTTGVLSTLVNLDADEQPREYNYTIILTDLDTPQESVDRIGSVSANITIAVQDANDNVPRFNQSVYEVSVVENSPVGSPVVVVGATDADYGMDAFSAPNGNNELRYFFMNAPANTFDIDPISGEITKRRVLDREQQEEYVLTVGVRDNPSSGAANVDTAVVRITVTDVNEHSPRADPAQYYAFVFEDTPVDSEIPTFVEVAWNIARK